MPVALSFLVGALISVQQAINGRIGITAGNAFSSTWFNFVFGTTALIVASATQVFWGDMYVSALPSDSWWVYTGGIVGVVYIAMSVWVVPKGGCADLRSDFSQWSINWRVDFGSAHANQWNRDHTYAVYWCRSDVRGCCVVNSSSTSAKDG